MAQLPPSRIHIGAVILAAPELVTAVYSRISDPLVKTARRMDLRCKYIFGVTSLLTALIFCAVHMIPALHAQ